MFLTNQIKELVMKWGVAKGTINLQKLNDDWLSKENKLLMTQQVQKAVYKYEKKVEENYLG